MMMSLRCSSKPSMHLVHRREPVSLLLPSRRCPPWTGPIGFSRSIRSEPGVTFCCSEAGYKALRKCAPLLEDSTCEEWKAIPDIWRTNSEKYSDRVALVDPYHNPPSKFTYKQVEDAILNFSEGLRVIGAVPGEKISLFADNSSRWLIADQGIMCTGTINVVRGTKSSNHELFQIYTHSDSVALVVENSEFVTRLLESFIPKVKVKFIILLWGDKSSLINNAHLIDIPLYSYDEVIKLGSENRLVPKEGECEKIKPDDVATIMYTSGTSGTPKGVMLTHQNLLHQVNNLWEIVPCEAGDIFLSMLPSWHAYERASEYFIFTHGIKQVYTNVKFLKEDLKRYQPQYLISVPLVYETLYNSIQKQISTSSNIRKFVAKLLIKISLLYMELNRIYEGKVLTKNPKPPPFIICIIEWVFAKILASILLPLHILAKKLIYSKIHSSIGISKAGISGGGSLPMYIDKFFEAIGIKVQNGYGLTETSPVAAARRPNLNVLGTIGHPIKDTEIKIVDMETGLLTRDGSKGIVKIKGPQVMKGYYKNERATEEALDASSWFSTGDIGWIVPKHVIGRSRLCGAMIVLEGRAKDTIVLSTGENVEPSEIEEAATRSSLINQIIVIGQDQRRLGAIIVPNKDEMLAILGDKMELTQEKMLSLLYSEVRNWTASCSFQIGPILIVDEPMTVENGMMTPTMKVRRDKVTAKYHDQIANMYK